MDVVVELRHLVAHHFTNLTMTIFDNEHVLLYTTGSEMHS